MSTRKIIRKGRPPALPTKGKWHLIKAGDYAIKLGDLISGGTLSQKDYILARALMNDLMNSLLR
jgi:hypothetical protein